VTARPGVAHLAAVIRVQGCIFVQVVAALHLGLREPDWDAGLQQPGGSVGLERLAASHLMTVRRGHDLIMRGELRSGELGEPQVKRRMLLNKGADKFMLRTWISHDSEHINARTTIRAIVEILMKIDSNH
jgi:hypothetical protein